jgi:plastocyanin
MSCKRRAFKTMKINISTHSGRILAAVTITGLLLALSSCTKTSTTSNITTNTTTTASGGTAVTINLVAQNMAFDKNSITVAAGANVTITFNNKDTIPHNFALYTNSSATPPAIFQGQTVTGPTTVTYTFTAPATPGTYFFRCDVHPTSMTGSFIVQ